MKNKKLEIEDLEKVPVEHYPTQVVEKPLVSVCVQTYQHVNYIKECLDSILMQKTDFDFEIIVGDDESTDGTREICIGYAKRFPDKVRLFLHKRENVIHVNNNPTGRFNMLYNLNKARGKYIALCEGDDYWTDPLKLQEQIRLLNGNKEITGSYTDTYIKTGAHQELKYWREPLQSSMILNDVIDKKSPFHTSSFLFRKVNIKEFPKWVYFMASGDMFLFAYTALNGNFIKADTTPTVYRKHADGVTNSSNHNNQGYHIGRLFLWTKFKKEYNIKLPKIDEVIRFHAQSLLNSNMSVSDINQLLKKLGVKQTISVFLGRSVVKSTVKKFLMK
jgi:glycosyltransferase involved in cell wall biosynthesis